MTFKDIVEFAERYDNLYIYGAGEMGKFLLEALKDKDIEVSGFIVSDDQSIAKPTRFGIPVIKLSNWHKSDAVLNSGIFIALSTYYRANVVNNLKEKKIFDYFVVQNEALNESIRKLHPIKPENFLHTTNPVSRGFGFERGKPIDRVYIERFLQNAAKDLQDASDILEVGSDDYSRKFFPDTVKPVKYHVLHYEQGMDLTNEKTLQKDLCDVFICTQVFNFIYNVKASIRGAHYLLKPGGTLLATVQGCIGQVSRTDMNVFGDYWRFTNLGIGKLVKEVFGEEQVQVYPYGNALAATAFVQGLAMEDLPDATLLDPIESEYAINIGIIAHKKG